MEIHQESHGDIEQFHVTHPLRLVDGMDFLDRFDFDQEHAADKQIELSFFLEDQAFVFDAHVFLRHNRDATKFKFLTQAFFVDALQEAGAKDAMDFDCRANCFPTQSVGVSESWMHRMTSKCETAGRGN